MKKIWKYSGILLLSTGIIHTIVGIIMGYDIYLEILESGFINAIGADFTRSFYFWFLICGIMIIIFGQTLHYYIRKTEQPAQRSLGFWLLAISIFGCFAEPVSGFWLFIPQAFIIIFAKREK